MALTAAAGGVLAPQPAVAAGITPPPLVFQSADGNVTIVNPNGTTVTGPAMALGTSPSVAAPRTGGAVAAYQASDGTLATLTSAGTVTRLNVTMALGTSPSIVAVDTGTKIAFQTLDHTLAYVDTSGHMVDTARAMAPGTSPSAASDGQGVWIAYQASDGMLSWTTASTTPLATHSTLSMRAGSSPSFALDNTSAAWIITYICTAGVLCYYYEWGYHDVVGGGAGIPVRSGTDISAVSVEPSDDIKIAFQSPSGALELADVNRAPGLVVLGPILKAETSPSITGLSDGSWRIAYQASSGEVRTWDQSTGDAGLGLNARYSTSPAWPRYKPPTETQFP